jgi:hypothetical protein
MSELPPIGFPPIVLTTLFSEQEPVRFNPNAWVENGQLHLLSTQEQGNSGFPVGGGTFRDALFMARLALLEGDDDDLYGLFVRQADFNSYFFFAISPAGRVIVGNFDGTSYFELVNGLLASDMEFNTGLKQPNLFQVLACGPTLTFMLNNMVVTGTMVDPRYKEGNLGFYAHHGKTSSRTELTADWFQIRGILPV